jgi:hypothetical protein
MEAIEPFNFVHFTSAGPVYLRATRLTSGKVMARRREAVGGRMFDTVAAAKHYLEESFALIFPAHNYDERCGPLQESPKIADRPKTITSRAVPI